MKNLSRFPDMHLIYVLLLINLVACSTSMPEWYEYPGSQSLKNTTFESLQDLGLANHEKKRVSPGDHLSEFSEATPHKALLTTYTNYLGLQKKAGPFTWKWQDITHRSLLPKAPFVTSSLVNNSLIWAFREDEPVAVFRPMAVSQTEGVPAEFQLSFLPDGSLKDLLTTQKHPLQMDDYSEPPATLKKTLIGLAQKPPTAFLHVNQASDLTYNLGEGAPQTLEAFQNLIPPNASQASWAVYHASLGVSSTLRPDTFHVTTKATGMFYRDLSNLTACYLQINFEDCLSRFSKYQKPQLKLPPYEARIANHILTELLKLYFKGTDPRDLNMKFVKAIIEKSSKTLLGVSQNDFQSVLIKILKRADGPRLIVDLFENSKTVGKLHPQFLHHLKVLTICLSQDLDTLNNIASEDDLFSMTTFLKEHPAIFNRYVKSLHDMGLTPFSEPVMAYFRLYYPDYSRDILKIFPASSQKTVDGYLSQLKKDYVATLQQKYRPDKGKVPTVMTWKGLDDPQKAPFPDNLSQFKFVMFVNSQDALSIRLVKKVLKETSRTFLKHVYLVDILHSEPEDFEDFLEQTGLFSSPLANRLYRIPLSEETSSFYKSMNLYSVPRIMILDKKNLVLSIDEPIPFSFKKTERDLTWSLKK